MRGKEAPPAPASTPLGGDAEVKQPRGLCYRSPKWLENLPADETLSREAFPATPSFSHSDGDKGAVARGGLACVCLSAHTGRASILFAFPFFWFLFPFELTSTRI